MKFNIKKLSKILTVFLLVFLTSLEALTFTVSAENQSNTPYPSTDTDYVYFNGKKYYKNLYGEHIDQYSVKENTVYYFKWEKNRSKGAAVYVTRVFEDPVCWGLFGTIRKAVGINLKTGKEETWDLGNAPADCRADSRADVFTLRRVDIDEYTSCRGIKYYKYKRGDAVGEYEVQENTPYLIKPSEWHCDLRIYVQRVFEYPIIFGTMRSVEGIDLDTGRSVVEVISKQHGCEGIYKMIKAQQ